MIATGMLTTGAPTPVAAADVASVTCDELPIAAIDPPGPMTSYVPINPGRIVDTRSGLGGVGEPVGDRCTLRIALAATGVPADAAGLALSVTSLGSKPGFLSVFPCAGGNPGTSNLNTRADQFPTPNLVVVAPDEHREICIFSVFEAEVIVDVAGWWTSDGDNRFRSVSPDRVFDSRLIGEREPIPARTATTVDVGAPTDSVAAVVNLTITQPAADGFLVAYPCDSPVPTASNLNFKADESRAVAAIVGLNPDGQICVFSNVDAHIVIDLSGYYSPAPAFGPAAQLSLTGGVRLADSRTTEAPFTSKFGNGSVRRIAPVVGTDNASQATAVTLNVVATQAEDPGYVTAYPCGQERPTASFLNYSPAGESTNLVTVDLSSSGEICLFTLSEVHLVVDLYGIQFAPPDTLAERISIDRNIWPSFTTSGTDYAVECGPAATRIELDLDLLSGVAARVNGVSVPTGIYDLPVTVDSLTTVNLRRGGQQADYYFRCIPPDFPTLDVNRTGEPIAGWYLTTLRTSEPGAAVFTVILDSHGAPIWYKRVDRWVVDLRRRADGRLLYAPNTGAYGNDPTIGYRVTSLSGTLIDEIGTVPNPDEPDVVFPLDHHDIVTSADGGRSVLSYPIVPDQDLTLFGEGYFVDDSIVDGVIQEIGPNDELLWSWRTSEHFGMDEVTEPGRFPQYPDLPYGGPVDPFHLNSLDRVADGTGDYLVSGRHLDAIFRVDRATGSLDWILSSTPVDAPNLGGGTRLTVIDDPLGGPLRPHDARLDGDVLTLFDNRTDSGQPARAVAFRIDDEAATATWLWQIDEPLGRTSNGLGVNRVQPDGSVLVNWGASLQPMFEEFDADHQSVLQITLVGGGQSYRIVKEPVTSFSATLLRMTAGGSADAP